MKTPVPVGWRTATVADICDLQNGHGFGPEDWDDHGLPIIRIQNLNGGQQFDYFSGTPDPDWMVPTGQLLFAWAGTRGVSFGPAIWSGPTGVLNQHIFKVTARHGIDQGWLYWALQEVTARIEARAHGFKATLLHVKKADIAGQRIIVPPLIEQERIAQPLTIWSQSIVTIERLLVSISKYKQALMQRILRPQHAADWSKFGWNRQPLGEVAGIDKESLASDTPPDFRFRYISLADIENGAISGTLPTLEFREAPSRARRLVKSGDILLSTVRPSLKGYARIEEQHAGSVASTGFAVLTVFSGVNPDYVYQYLYSDDIQRQVAGLVTGSNYPAISTTDVENLLINIPSLEKQHAIANVLNAIDREMALLSTELEAMRREGRALMSALLTGKRRVRLPAPAEAAA